MASIKKIKGSYKITVSQGLDANGKQIRHYMTWKPEKKMTENAAMKAAEKVAAEFELKIMQGQIMDDRQTFQKYAEYVLRQKERELKPKTIYEYRQLTKRIYPALGHLKLTDIRPQHISSFYDTLASSRQSGAKATAKIDLNAVVKERKLSMTKLAELAGISRATVSAACRGESITRENAELLAQALDLKFSKAFTVTEDTRPLSGATKLAYHRFISTVLDQAENELLVPYNAAKKARIPKLKRKEVNYFQPEDITAILDALEGEPLKWRALVHLLIVTGCRRGEILGLKWSKLDLTEGKAKIDNAILYTKERGIYEGPTKTGNVRTVGLPGETVDLLREWRKEALALRLANGDRWQDKGFVFVQDNGKPMHPDSIAHWLRAFADRHGLPHINAHAFRHTVASVLIANGTDVVTVSRQLGHLDVSTTETFYSHIIEENKQKATDCIADALLRKKRA